MDGQQRLRRDDETHEENEEDRVMRELTTIFVRMLIHHGKCTTVWLT